MKFLRLFFLAVRFRSITEQYYRKAEGILAMYDLTDVSSFTAVRGWMDSVKVSQAMQNTRGRMTNNPALYKTHDGSSVQEKAGDGVVLMLLANKLDQADSQRAVTAQQGQRLAEV